MPRLIVYTVSKRDLRMREETVEMGGGGGGVLFDGKKKKIKQCHTTLLQILCLHTTSAYVHKVGGRWVGTYIGCK